MFMEELIKDALFLLKGVGYAEVPQIHHRPCLVRS